MQAAADAPALTLHAQPLSAPAMDAYGWMLDIDAAFAGAGGRAINAGTSRRADLPGGLSLHADGGEPLVTVFRAQAQPASGPWHLLERHRLGTQTFVPLARVDGKDPGADGTACVLLVALGADAPDLSTLRAFTVGPRQAFTLKPGTWHHPLIALADRDFLVIERRAAVEDCEVLHLPRPVRVELQRPVG